MRIITNSLHSDRACFGYSKPAVHIRALLSVKLKYQIRLRHHDMSEDGQYLKRRRVCDAGMGTSIQALVDEAAHQASDSFKVPGLVINNHVFKVPLDHSKQEPGEIDVFLRELTTPANANRKLPYLLYLQGGPGFESPRPTEASGWLKSACNSFRVILMDQRGTGKSTPITVRNLARNHTTPEAQAKYLSYFRADSIVRDAEMVRTRLVPQDNYNGRWSVLGQSFGGFCIVTYLSIAPEGLIEAMMTGGIPPNVHEPCAAENVYRACFARLLTVNQRYYQRFPADMALVQRIVSHLDAQPGGGIKLASGSNLTPRALQTLGLSGLGSGGGFERLHYLLDSFFDADGEITPAFIKGFESWQSWESNPLYALLHEAIYCQGTASRWAGQRVRDEPQFKDVFDATAAVSQGRPVYFTGEMVFPWMFEDFAALQPYAAAANLLAEKADWGPLYNEDMLSLNTVPVAATTYVEDMYVDFELAQNTARRVQGLRQWMTNEYKHSGIRDDGVRILDRMLSMVRDTILQD